MVEPLGTELQNTVLSFRRALQEQPLDKDLAELGLEGVLQLQTYMWRRGYWRQWSADVDLAIKKAEELGLQEHKALLFAYRAGLDEALGDWPRAVITANAALAYSSTHRSRAEALIHLATAHYNLGKIQEANEEFLEAISIATDVPQQIAAKHKHARVLRTLGETDLAARRLEECLGWASHSNRWLYAELLLDHAAACRPSNIPRARESANASLRIYSEMSFERGLGYANLELGILEYLESNHETALTHLVKSRLIFERSNYSPGLAHVFLGLGKIASADGEFSKAEGAFDRSYLSAKKCNYRRGLLRALVRGLSVSSRGLQLVTLGKWCFRMLQALITAPRSIVRIFLTRQSKN